MNRFTVLALVAIAAVTLNAAAADFHAGFAKRDITAAKPVPMWGTATGTMRFPPASWIRSTPKRS
jgi:hypothetical protein